ncbi:MAG TPA: hotdog fold domain-containing protein [Solirubrobacterales bacterium]|nr:hotdog fold domain-containing protein [Solirubrobacterales bacterium]
MLAPEPGERTTLAAYRLAERVPFGVGRLAFSGAMRLAAPYFLSIPATVVSAEPGRAEAKMRHLPWVRNHLGTVHAIALCNLAELTMGLAAEATVPASHRWIPKGMTVAYQAKARGTMRATATIDLPEPLPRSGEEGAEVPAAISVRDDAGTEVFSAEIRLWITAT